MNITITQLARCCASLAMTFSVTTPAAARVKKSASQDGAGRIAKNHFAPTDAFTDRAKNQVFVNVATATKERDATSAWHIQDAKMASALNHGSVVATKTGVEYSAIKVSDRNKFI